MRTQKDAFSLPPDLHYLNCAYLAPLARSVEEAGIAGVRLRRDPTALAPADFFTDSEVVRERFAHLINAPDPSSVAIIPAVSYGMAIVARNTSLDAGQNIVVLGHSHNDALQMLLDGGFATTDSDPLKAWLGIAHDVYEAVVESMGEYTRDAQERAMELETIVMGLRNLFSYPWIESRVSSGKLELYGWHFDLESGELLGYMPGTGQFESFD